MYITTSLIRKLVLMWLVYSNFIGLDLVKASSSTDFCPSLCSLNSMNLNCISTAANPMSCKTINVSLDENCQILITKEMLLVGYIPEDATVTLSVYGVEIENPIDSNYLNMTVTGMVTDNETGNSCWSLIKVEDKLAPIINCQNDTMNCIQFMHSYALEYDVYDCSHYSVKLLDEVIEKFECDPEFIKRVTLTWASIDANGISDTCNQVMMLRRVPIDLLECPKDHVYFECNEFYADDKGNPSPYETGMPTILGYNVWPPNDFLCNFYAEYRDEELGEISCVRKIRRIWTVREWFCGEEITQTCIQLIIIRDMYGPYITHPPHFYYEYSTSSKTCTALINAPPIGFQDACHQANRVDISYQNGVLLNRNGGIIELPLGPNTITYTVYDECYNSNTWSTDVYVKDGDQPIVICDKRTVVSLTAHGNAWVQADVFDDGSFDECGSIKYEVRRMDRNACRTVGEDDWGPEVGFCCADLNKEIMVGLRITDHSGNTNICMVTTEVQDKIPPVVECPPNITVDCRFDWDPNHTEVFGKMVMDIADRDSIIIPDKYHPKFDHYPFDGYIIDNCPPAMEVEIDVTNIKQCGTGYLLRIFYGVDPKNNAFNACVQRIDFLNYYPFTEANIEWPEDLDTIGCFSSDALAPARLVAPYSFPIIQDDECRLTGYEYKDQVFNATGLGEPCFKIFRHWKVIDWCTQVNGEFVAFSYTQVIKVFNTENPIITFCRDTVVCSYDVNCAPVAVRIPVSGSDQCTPASELFWKHKIDFDNDGIFDHSNEGVGLNYAEGTFPLGRHRIKWEVEDRCGNTALCERILDIRNCKQPTAYCLFGLSVGLVPMDLTGDNIPDVKMDSVWANDVDAGSSHPCRYPVKLSFSPDVNDTYRVFDCDSLGQRFVTLYATDVNGNQSFCRTFINVQDNNPNIPPNCRNTVTVNVNGLIATFNGSKVQSAKVSLDNAQIEVYSDYEGTYTFNQMPTGGKYVVKPSRNDDWLNGVTTADIVKLQKHILGIEQFVNPYQYIAGDVNNSKTITAKDIADLRKLILGITSDISYNTSWRFVDKSYIFKDVSNTLSEKFPEIIDIQNLQSDFTADFIAVKIGDLNENAKSRGLTNGGQPRNRKMCTLGTADMQFLKGNMYTINFQSPDLKSFEALQFTLQWNVDMIQVVSVDGNAAIGMEASNFNTTRLEKGLLSASWNGNVDQSVKLMSLTFIATADGRLSESLFIGSSMTSSLAFEKESLQEGMVRLAFEGTHDLDKSLVLLQNEPNPWKKESTIGFVLPEESIVELLMYDLSGKQYYKKSEFFSKGYHEWIVTEEEIPATGILYYQINTNIGSATKKMIKLN